jgi:uncharacterized protein YjbI with pentapeptide repeats
LPTLGNFHKAGVTILCLTDGDLTFVDFSGVNLSETDLVGADITGAVLPDGSIHD